LKTAKTAKIALTEIARIACMPVASSAENWGAEMRILSGLILFACAALPSTAAMAQALTCNSPTSCARLHCQRSCVETWDHGVCLGGYCPQGFVARTEAETAVKSEKTNKKDLVIRQASPALQQKIRELIDSGQ
jgi:hypothetical protein